MEFDEFDTVAVVAIAVIVIGCCCVETTMDATDVDGVDEIETEVFCGWRLDVSITFATGSKKGMISAIVEFGIEMRCW